MLKYAKKINKFWNKSSIFLKLIVLILILYIFNHLYKKAMVQEGFSELEGLHQNESYILKKNKDVYDDFYANMYDELVVEDSRLDFEMFQLQKLNILNKNSSVLDIGCGTGHHVNQLTTQYKDIVCVGIDQSRAMINQAKNLYPTNNYQQKDVLQTLSFEANQFNLTICLYFTIYYIKNKREFFNNCSQWLIPSGYLVVHLVDKNKFSPILPAGEVSYINPQKISTNRITQTKALFNNIHYDANFALDKDDSQNKALFKEKFTNYKNNKVRENQHELYMDDRENIISYAKASGFNLVKVIDMKRCGYDYQYLYVLQKQ